MENTVTFITANLTNLWMVIASIIAIASAVAAMLPKSHLNDDVNAIIRVLNMVALNFNLPSITQATATATTTTTVSATVPATPAVT